MSESATRDEFVALHESLNRLVRAYQFRDRDRICCHDVSVSQCHALEVLSDSDGMTLNELAAALYLEKSTVSRAVQALIDKGYVARSPHPDDGRAVLLFGTPAGAALCRQIDREMIQEERDLFRDLDRAAIGVITEGLSRLAGAIEERIESADGVCCWNEAADAPSCDAPAT